MSQDGPTRHPGEGEGGLEPHLHLVADSRAAELLADEVASGEEGWNRETALDAVPLHISIATEVDLDAADPALDAVGKRRCIAERKAGGRCTVTAMGGLLTCPAHGGILDSAAGGRALAEKRREARMTEEERMRLARLGTRGVIADRLARQAGKVAQVVDLLLDSATQGDVQSAKLLIPYLNQGLGMPTERVQVSSPQTAEDLAQLDTESLAAFVAERRAAMRDAAVSSSE